MQNHHAACPRKAATGHSVLCVHPSGASTQCNNVTRLARNALGIATGAPGVLQQLILHTPLDLYCCDQRSTPHLCTLNAPLQQERLESSSGCSVCHCAVEGHEVRPRWGGWLLAVLPPTALAPSTLPCLSLQWKQSTNQPILVLFFPLQPPNQLHSYHAFHAAAIPSCPSPQPSSQLDEHLEALAHLHRGTLFLRTLVGRKSPLVSQLGLPSLPGRC